MTLAMKTSSDFQPSHEPLRTTLVRTILIALVAGAALTRGTHGRVGWLMSTLIMLWPSLGGHYVELFFLNWLRPQLSAARGVQIAARVGVWFVGGIVLGLAMLVSARLLAGFRPAHVPAWWLAGLGFIGVELVAQLGLMLIGRPNFYDGLG